MEAMAMQIPVVSTNTVGIPELIEHQKEGLLVEQKDVHQLAAALELFLKNPEVRLKMGRQGRTKVEQHFNDMANLQLENNKIDIVYTPLVVL